MKKPNPDIDYKTLLKGLWEDRENFSKFSLKERYKLDKYKEKIESGRSLTKWQQRKINKLVNNRLGSVDKIEGEYEKYYKKKAKQDAKKPRTKLNEKFNYEKQKANHHWKKIESMQKTLYYSHSRGSFSWILPKPEFLDYNNKNHNSNLTDKEMEDLIKEVQEWTNSVNTKNKKLEKFLYNLDDRIWESYIEGRISEEEVIIDLSITKRILIYMGFSKTKVDTFIKNNIPQEYQHLAKKI